MMALIRKMRLRRDVRRGSPYETGWLAFEAGDLSRAASIWRPLAERGNASAMYGLGLIAERGPRRNMDEAAGWMKKAAEEGLAIAATALGRLYEIGEPYGRDFAEAARLYNQAAQAGDAYAQVYLGRLYENGEGVEMDLKQAFDWYRRAAEQGDPGALAILSRWEAERQERTD